MNWNSTEFIWLDWLVLTVGFMQILYQIISYISIVNAFFYAE